MLWGQKIKVFTDHKNLTRDALGSTLDRVYRWRLLLEEFSPEIVYIKGINNTVADAISRLDYTPVAKPEEAYEKGKSQPAMCHSAFMQSLADEYDIDEPIVKWKTVSKLFNTYQSFNFSTGVESVHSEGTVSAHKRGEKAVMSSLYSRGNEEQESIYPPTVKEIADAQQSSAQFKEYFWRGGELPEKYVNFPT